METVDKHPEKRFQRSLCQLSVTTCLNFFINFLQRKEILPSLKDFQLTGRKFRDKITRQIAGIAQSVEQLIRNYQTRARRIEYADVAQWQSISLVMRRLWVRFPPSAPRRSKLYIVCSDFFQKVRAHSFRCSSFSSRKRSAGLRLDEMGALDWCIFFVNIVQSRQNLRVTTVETVEKACHCEEAQRADVAIRS